MSLFLVARRAELFVKLYGGRVPFQNLKIHPLKPALFSNFGDIFQNRFADASPAKLLFDVNVFEINPALPAKTGEIRIKNRISNRRVFPKNNNRFSNSRVAEKRRAQAFFRHLEKIREIFILSKLV